MKGGSLQFYVPCILIGNLYFVMEDTLVEPDGGTSWVIRYVFDHPTRPSIWFDKCVFHDKVEVSYEYAGNIELKASTFHETIKLRDGDPLDLADSQISKRVNA